jgi:hypothetical protein
VNLVFMNSLQKKVGGMDEINAQVRISEENGHWEIVWDETNEKGKIISDCWFNDQGSESMMQIFKQRITGKLSEGFLPVLEGIGETFSAGESKAMRTPLLQYYSEQHVNQDAFQKLRKWRTIMAAREGLAPYLICTNKVLQMICTFLPQTNEELQQIPGMGPRKVEVYGKDIIHELKGFEQKKPFPLIWVEETLDNTSFKQWLFRQRDEKLKKELGSKQMKQQLLQGILDGYSIDELQKESSLSRREVIEWMEVLDKEGYDVLPLAQIELEAVTKTEKKKAWNGFVTLGDRYLKPVLEQVYDTNMLKELDLNASYEWLRLLRIQYRRDQESVPQSNAG